MSEAPPAAPAVYRAGTHMLVVVGVFAVLFVGLGTAVLVARGDWKALAVAASFFAALFLLLPLLRLEIGPAGFRYRNLSGSREVAFADIRRAYFEVVEDGYAPWGVAAFWVERRTGGRVKVNLRTFSVEGAAALFTALEQHGVVIEVPDRWAARRVAHQVRAAQAKMRGETAAEPGAAPDRRGM
jgi:hypothetical protein